MGEEMASGLLAWPAVLRDLWVAMAMLQSAAVGGVEVVSRPGEKGGFWIGLRYRETAEAEDFMMADVGLWEGSLKHFGESFERLKVAAPSFSPEDVEQAAADWLVRHPQAAAPAP